MKYMIVLQFRQKALQPLKSIVDRDSEEQARDDARRWARLVSNASGATGGAPFIWLLFEHGTCGMFTPIYVEPFPARHLR